MAASVGYKAFYLYLGRLLKHGRLPDVCSTGAHAYVETTNMQLSRANYWRRRTSRFACWWQTRNRLECLMQKPAVGRLSWRSQMHKRAERPRHCVRTSSLTTCWFFQSSCRTYKCEHSTQSEGQKGICASLDKICSREE